MPDVLRTVGRYEVVRELGRSASGRLYLARRPDLDGLVALEELRRPDLDGLVALEELDSLGAGGRAAGPAGAWRRGGSCAPRARSRIRTSSRSTTSSSTTAPRSWRWSCWSAARCAGMPADSRSPRSRACWRVCWR